MAVARKLIASNKDRKSLAIETMKTDPGLMPMVMAMYEGDENKVERVVNAVFIDASSEKRRLLTHVLCLFAGNSKIYRLLELVHLS